MGRNEHILDFDTFILSGLPASPIISYNRLLGASLSFRQVSLDHQSGSPIPRDTLTAALLYTQSRHPSQEEAALQPHNCDSQSSAHFFTHSNESIIRDDSRSARFLLPPILHINLIHRREILHIRDEDVDFDDVVDRGSCSFEDCGEVFDALVLSSPPFCQQRA